MTHEGGIETSPASCEISPRSSANRLDLPLPLAPITPTLCPGCTVSEARWSSRVVPRASVRSAMRNTVSSLRSLDFVFVIDDQRGMIGEAPVGVDRGAARSGGDPGRRDLIVDAPAHVLRPCLAAIGPPRVLLGFLVD